MSIQSTINQGISLTGLLLTQTPWAEAHKIKVREAAETRRLGRELQGAQAVTESTLTSVEDLEKLPTEKERETAVSMYSRALHEEGRLEEELFRREPTQERLSEVIRTQSATEEFDEAIADYERDAKEALEREQRRQEISREILRPFDPNKDQFRW